MPKNDKRVKITLECTSCKRRNYITMKNKIAATPPNAGEIDEPSNDERNWPNTIATPATDPGPLTHISIQIFKKPQNGPKPSRMMWNVEPESGNSLLSSESVNAPHSVMSPQMTQTT